MTFGKRGAAFDFDVHAGFARSDRQPVRRPLRSADHAESLHAPGRRADRLRYGADLTSYSVTLNTTTGTLAGEINEAYVYIKNSVLMLYAGKKVGDLDADLGVAGTGRRPDHRIRRGRSAGADGKPHQQTVLRGCDVGDTDRADVGDAQISEQPATRRHDEQGHGRRQVRRRIRLWDGNIAPFGIGIETGKKIVETGR